MGKVFNSMILGTLITLALLLLNGSGSETTSIFLMLFNPGDYGTNGFYLLLAGFATITGGITIGIAVLTKQDWLARAGIVLSLNSILVAPLVDLFRFVVGQTNFIASNCDGISPVCSQLNAIEGMGQIFGIVFVGPLFLYVFWACMEYIWKGDH